MGFGTKYVTIYVDSDHMKTLVNIGKNPNNRYEFDSYVFMLPTNSDHWGKQGVRYGIDSVREFLSTEEGWKWLQGKFEEVQSNYDKNLDVPSTSDEIVYYSDFQTEQHSDSEIQDILKEIHR